MKRFILLLIALLITLAVVFARTPQPPDQAPQRLETPGFELRIGSWHFGS